MPRKNKITLRTGTGVPNATDFVTSEPAWDSANGKLYIKNAAGAMVEITGSGGGGGGSPELVYSFATTASFPGTGNSSLLYFATDTGRMYRWTGSVYVEVGPVGGGSGLGWSNVPATSSATGTAGDIAYDGDRLYICTATNFWEAAALSRWDGDPFWSSVTYLMRFNGSNGSTTFTDLSPTGVTATASGAAAVSTAQAKFGQSLVLNGTNAGLTLGNTGSAFTFAGDFTIDAWVYITAANTYHPVIESRASADFAPWICGIYNINGGLRLDFVTSSGRLTGSTTAVSLNTWTHIAWVRKDSTLRCYVNGVRDNASFSIFGSLTPQSTVLVGCSVDPTYTAGYFDDLRVTKAARYDAASFSVPTVQAPTFSA